MFWIPGSSVGGEGFATNGLTVCSNVQIAVKFCRRSGGLLFCTEEEINILIMEIADGFMKDLWMNRSCAPNR